MLILSYYKDYYDTAIGYGGIDRSIVYKRRIKELERDFDSKCFDLFDNMIDNNFNKNFLSPIGYNDLFNIYFCYVMFCGELYPLIKLHIITYGYTNKKTDFFFYDFDSFKEFINKRFLKKMKKKKYRNHKNFLKECETFFKTSNNDKLTLIDYHIMVNSPIILFEKGYNITLNPKLYEIEFYKVIDAFQAFQKLEMFLSGVMVKDEKEIIQVDDISLRDKKGFNDMSFKKEKNNKG